MCWKNGQTWLFLEPLRCSRSTGYVGVCVFTGKKEGGVSTRLAPDGKQRRLDNLRQERRPRQLPHRSQQDSGEC